LSLLQNYWRESYLGAFPKQGTFQVYAWEYSHTAQPMLAAVTQKMSGTNNVN